MTKMFRKALNNKNFTFINSRKIKDSISHLGFISIMKSEVALCFPKNIFPPVEAPAEERRKAGRLRLFL
jgi:hypothetical protein